MKLLTTIKESDIFLNQVPTPKEQLGEIRQSVRIILLDENKKIAMGYYPPREGSLGGYNLPGGGVDEGESIKEALLRESLEETGCHIKNIRELGLIREFGVGKKVKHNQDTHCFVANIDGEKGIPKFTDEEIKDMLEIRWLTLADALESVNSQSDSFAKIRTLTCLQEVKNQMD